MLRYERKVRPAVGDMASDPRRPPGVADVGRALRRERLRQGLSRRDVSRRLGISEDRLRAAEAGLLGRTDRLSALRTVRSFADLLGLPGDRFAQIVLERWPSPPPAGSQGRPARRDEPTATIPAVRTAFSPSSPGGEILFGSPFTPFDADFVTYDGSFDPADGPFGTGDFAAFTGDATGITPVVPSPGSGDGRPRALPVPVRAAAAALVLAVLAAGAMLAVDRMHPSWLQGIGLTRSDRPAAPAPVGHKTSPTAKAADARGASGASGPVVADAMRPSSTSEDTAALDPGPGPVRVTLSAVGAPCWAQVTDGASDAPLYSGDITAGSSRTFTIAGTSGAEIEIGSGAGRVSVTSASGTLSTYRPPVAPFTLSVRSSS